jgi:hypothetical protein
LPLLLRFCFFAFASSLLLFAFAFAFALCLCLCSLPLPLLFAFAFAFRFSFLLIANCQLLFAIRYSLFASSLPSKAPEARQKLAQSVRAGKR